MFKRVIWMGTGVAMGAGSAFWAKRKVVHTVERYLPDELARRAGASARTVGRTVRLAAAEGRTAMHDREAELRAQADARTLAAPQSRLSRRRA
ncbi:MAG: hypothetical protein M3Z46_03810, partial [Actinomycetota bacterium]|nr:hypothetical protein [Actinomycetota bacterium]